MNDKLADIYANNAMEEIKKLAEALEIMEIKHTTPITCRFTQNFRNLLAGKPHDATTIATTISAYLPNISSPVLGMMAILVIQQLEEIKEHKIKEMLR